MSMSMPGLDGGWQPSQADRQNSTSSGEIENETENDNEDCSPEQETPPAPSNGNKKAPPPTDKTISCVSCRKRKLKCDRIKPRCGTCTRLRHDCEFPERKRNLGSKRRNMKELEARLAQVETQLVAETKLAFSSEVRSVEAFPTIKPLSAFSTEPDWNTIGMDMDISLDIGMGGGIDSAYDLTQGFGLQNGTMHEDQFFSQELLALGLQEPLPPQDMMDDLNAMYFDSYHKTMPLMHKYRYYASLDRAPHMRPPVCLRYAMWTMAASISEKYNWFEDALYERARRYLQQDEMKGHGEAFVSVYYVQAWAIISTYEASKTYFSRSWMSSGRTVRLCHMLGLHRLDGDGNDLKRILQPPRDWIELEERRRAFWAAFYVDRWASSGTGWPMLINEREIMTNLPASEEAFENGIRQDTVSLEESLTPEGASKATPFGGIILSAALFGHNFEHLHRTGPLEKPEDLANGEFWKRHRKMDNVLSNTFMFLPDHLRLPQGVRDMNVPLIHMNIHASAICLHQAAILTAEKHKLDVNFKRQCRTRSVTAAEEVVNIMRMIAHVDVTHLSSWTGFCLYVAAGVLVQDKKLDQTRATSLANLDFLLSAMRSLARRHTITHHFIAQLELDIEASGIRNVPPIPGSQKCTPLTPLHGIIGNQEGHSIGIEEMTGFVEGYTNPSDESEPYHKIGRTALTGMPASSRDPIPEDQKSKTWDLGMDSCPSPLIPRNFASAGAAAFPSETPSNQLNNVDFCPYATSGIRNDTSPSLNAENTPPSDASTPSMTQYAIRTAVSEEDQPSFRLPNLEVFHAPTEWSATYRPNPMHTERQGGNSIDRFLENQMWGINGETPGNG